MALNNNYSYLHQDINIKLCEFLDLDSLNCFSRTSKEVYNLINSNKFCQKKFLYDFAVNTSFHIQKKFAQSMALKEIASGQAKTCDTIGAKRAFALSEQSALSIRKDFKRSKALVKIAKALAKAGYIKEAKAIDLPVEAYYDRSMLLKEIAITQSKIGNKTKATKNLVLAEETVPLIKDDAVKTKALKKIIRAQMQTNNATRAIDIALPLEDNFDKSTALLEIALFLVKAHNIKEAKAIFILSRNAALLIGDDSEKSSVLRKITTAQIQTGDRKEAKETVLSIKDDFNKSIALGEVALSLVKAHDIIEAQEMLIASKNAASLLLDGNPNKSIALYRIALVLKEMGNEEEAKKIFDLSKSAARLINDKAARSMILKQLDSFQVETEENEPATFKKTAIAQAKLGDIESARKAASQIEDSSSRSRTLEKISLMQISAGNPIKAKDTAFLIEEEDSYLKVMTLSKIAVALAEKGDIVEAKATIGDIKKIDPHASITTGLQVAQIIQNIRF